MTEIQTLILNEIIKLVTKKADFFNVRFCEKMYCKKIYNKKLKDFFIGEISENFLQNNMYKIYINRSHRMYCMCFITTP